MNGENSGAAEWAIGGAIEHGAFLMALASVLLTCIGILLALAGVIAYIRVKDTARKAAREEAMEIASKLAESAAIRYLEIELPNIYREYVDLARNAATYNDGDDIAEKEGG